MAAVAKAGNISYAAAAIGMQQANISKYIKNLEARIGLKIFERSTREIVLTDFGIKLMSYVEVQLNYAKTTERFIEDYKESKNGIVTIYAPAGIMKFLSREIIPQIRDAGDIVISLKIYNPTNEEFHAGMTFPEDADILFTYANPADESLVALNLARFPVQAYAAPTYLLENPISSPEELHNHSCILTHSVLIEDANVWQFQSNNKVSIKYRVTGNYICDNSMTAIELARHGLGILFTSRYTVREDIESRQLLPCFDDTTVLMLDLKAIFKKREHQPFRVQYVLDNIVALTRRYIDTNGGL